MYRFKICIRIINDRNFKFMLSFTQFIEQTLQVILKYLHIIVTTLHTPSLTILIYSLMYIVQFSIG